MSETSIDNPVGWFEIYVQDTARAKRFYETVLGVKLEKMPGDMDYWLFPMVEHGKGASGALLRMAGRPSGGNSTVVYFSCEDCSAEESRVGQGGGKVLKPKSAIGKFGFISLVTDPDGNMIGLHSRK